MKRFLLHTFLFISLVLITLYGVFWQAGGHSDDPFYVRFTTHKQQSMILGTSRAAQGLLPAVFNEVLGRDDLYNFAFTAPHSPWGPTYLGAIKKKINQSKEGIFVLDVSPLNLSIGKGLPDDTLSFNEVNLTLAKINSVDSKPNIPYLLNNYRDNSEGGRYYDLIRKSKWMYLHEDGWLEIFCNQKCLDGMEANIKVKVESYKKQLPAQKYSETRRNYLIKTIEYLKQFGKVYLVRLPLHPEMMKLENQYMPDFNDKIDSAVQLSSGYLDLTGQNAEFIYHDGNHLYSESAREVSKIIAEWIQTK